MPAAAFSIALSGVRPNCAFVWRKDMLRVHEAPKAADTAVVYEVRQKAVERAGILQRL